MQSAQQKLAAALQQRHEAGTYRQLKSYKGIDFSSNDYLGLAQEGIDPSSGLSSGLSHGSTGSRLITGHSPDISALETQIAQFHGYEAALLFSSGYQANLGLLACLCDKTDMILSDSLIHASLIDGIRLSYGQRQIFAHNDMADLEAKLAHYAPKISGQIYVVAEALYSMDGDTAPIAEMAALCQHYGAALIIDEAHSNGIYGPQGRGFAAQLGMQGNVFASIFTFGKAAGLHGAVICGSNTLIDYLINFCRPFIYTTAPAPSTLYVIEKGYEKITAADDRRAQLWANIDYFRAHIASPNRTINEFVPPDLAMWLDSDSPVQGLIVPSFARAKALADYVQHQGFNVKAILSPTVAQGQERLRICLHSFNSRAQIDDLVYALRSGLQSIGNHNKGEGAMKMAAGS